MYRLLLLSFLVLQGLALMAQENDYAREIVKTLSSEAFKGRAYVGDGNKKAAGYIKNQFQSIGLKPIEESFAQPFDLKVNTFPSDMSLKIDSLELVPGQDYIIDPYSSSLKGNYQVLQLKMKDLLNEDILKKTINTGVGKVLLVDVTKFNPKDKKEEQLAGELLNVLKYNPQVPLAAVIVYTNKKLTWSTANMQAAKPSFILNKELDLSQIKTVDIQVSARLINYTSENIVGYIKGSAQSDSFLVAMAHYDHLGLMGANTYFPGANDNASGIAMLLTLARHFQKYPPKYSMVFIATGAEEIGLLGARHFIEHPLIQVDKIKFLVNFDLAGTGDEGIKVVNGSVHQKPFNDLRQINDRLHYLPSVQKRGEACNSDHCLFHQKGVPCFYIYTLGGIKAYHDIYDRNETLPLSYFDNYSQLMIDFFTQFE
ncbi:MAG: M20/M25/M40 family metallo-hydrolase [Carboxylicivirga sp.]|jgi:hypothetical protein|nr:M20/M25/M40 family metallo-hydrolase [Carboxylicivirga sp.]